MTRIEWVVFECFDGEQEYLHVVTCVPSEADARQIYAAMRPRMFGGVYLRLVRREVSESTVEESR